MSAVATPGAVLEVGVPVATVWTSPEAPRPDDEAALRDLPDLRAWVDALDADGTPERRLGLHGRTLTQLLLGEPVAVIEVRDDWTRIAAPLQPSSTDECGYPGWVRTAHLASPAEAPTPLVARVEKATATCEVDGGANLVLSCGTGLALAAATSGGGEATVPVVLPGGRLGRIPRADIRLARFDAADAWTPDGVVATARQFLGLRYLWGGTSAWGLDCSGLVHLAYRLQGRVVPRDAFDQAAASDLEPVELDAVRTGDLYFFARPGERVYHVGFATSPVAPDGARTMLHAPEGGGLIEDVPMAADREALLVAAGRFSPR